MNTAILVASETLMTELGIKKDAYYRDINFLGIEIIKDNSGKSYLSPSDAQRIKSLRKWVNQTGTRRGFVDKSEEVQEDSAEGSALIIRENEQLAQTYGEHTDEDIYVTPDEPTAQVNVDGLMREAAQLKAREVAMPHLVKRAVADQMTEEDLPLDLQEKVNLAREAANPKFTPAEVASQLLSQWRATKGG